MATKFYKMSYAIVEDDEDHHPDWVCQILYEVLEVVAPSTSSMSYAVYKVLQRAHDFQDPFQMFAAERYNVFALLKCVDELPDRKVVTELRVELQEALKQSDLYTMSGCETITEITCNEFDDLSNEHCERQASCVYMVYFMNSLSFSIHVSDVPIT
jgi:hypothetical protein